VGTFTTFHMLHSSGPSGPVTAMQRIAMKFSTIRQVIVLQFYESITPNSLFLTSLITKSHFKFLCDMLVFSSYNRNVENINGKLKRTDVGCPKFLLKTG
jgi:hypothetical protein